MGSSSELKSSTEQWGEGRFDSLLSICFWAFLPASLCIGLPLPPAVPSPSAYLPLKPLKEG